jgi:hypothetical protein
MYRARTPPQPSITAVLVKKARVDLDEYVKGATAGAVGVCDRYRGRRETCWPERWSVGLITAMPRGGEIRSM